MNNYVECTEEFEQSLHHYMDLTMSCSNRGFGKIQECPLGKVAVNSDNDLIYRCTGTTLQWIVHEQSGGCDVENDTRLSPDEGWPQICVYEGVFQTWQCDHDASKQVDANGVKYMCTGKGLWEVDPLD